MSAQHACQRSTPFGHGPEVVRHLTQKDLARRWGCSARTLERWRVAGQGPLFLKLNGRVLYRLEDVEAYEVERLHESTTTARRSA